MMKLRDMLQYLQTDNAFQCVEPQLALVAEFAHELVIVPAMQLIGILLDLE